MKKLGLILFAGLLGLSLASCGSTPKDSGNNNHGGEESGNHDNSTGGNSGYETNSFQQTVENFESAIKGGFLIKANGSNSMLESSSSFSFGVNNDGYWFMESLGDSFYGSLYKKNGDGYLLYDADIHGEFSGEPEEVTKEEAEYQYAIDLGMLEGRLFAYYDFLDEAELTANEFYLGRECTSYKYEFLAGSPVTFTVDDTLKINLKYKQVVQMEESTYEDTFSVSQIKTGNDAKLPLD